jgi:hypothetical protein
MTFSFGTGGFGASGGAGGRTRSAKIGVYCCGASHRFLHSSSNCCDAIDSGTFNGAIKLNGGGSEELDETASS